MKGILFFLGKAECCSKEAVQRRSCKSAGAEDCKDLTILVVPLFENVAKEQSEENGKAVECVAHQNTSSKQDADLPMPKDPLNDCARNRPDEQPLCDLGGGSRRDCRDIGFGNGGKHLLTEVIVGKERHHDEGDRKAEQLGIPLLLAPEQLKLFILAVAAKDISGLEVIAHVGKAGTGRAV